MTIAFGVASFVLQGCGDGPPGEVAPEPTPAPTQTSAPTPTPPDGGRPREGCVCSGDNSCQEPEIKGKLPFCLVEEGVCADEMVTSAPNNKRWSHLACAAEFISITSGTCQGQGYLPITVRP